MLRLYKKEKLCSVAAIDMLFSRDASSCSCLAYPLRAVWRENAGRNCDAPMQFLISVPKKRLKHAVDRVKMRRRIREAYRLCHQDYALGEGAKVDVAFVYVGAGLEPYHRIEKAMRRVLGSIAKPQAKEEGEAQ